MNVGERVPSFALPSSDGRTVRLEDLLGKGPIVVYFYPKDDTPGCTAEACAFRDQYEVFKDAGAEVVGVSSDGITSHESFAKKHRLPFLLLSDERRALRKAWRVPATLGLLPGRVTYVLDREGVVRHVFSSQLMATKHVSEALEVVRALKGA